MTPRQPVVNRVPLTGDPGLPEAEVGWGGGGACLREQLERGICSAPCPQVRRTHLGEEAFPGAPQAALGTATPFLGGWDAGAQEA